jgi:DNA-binding winged helix-turn-helix (wHTH) protein/tetratricopeptide (TPR) repeat protein
MADFDPVIPRERIDLAAEREFELGGMTVTPADCAVATNGERREVQPRVMQVLVALAKERPRVVSREKLVQLCWDGRIVGDDSVNRCVLALRNLAREFTPAPFEIETVPRVGHSLVENGYSHRSGPSGERGRRTLLISGLAIMLAAIAGLLLARSAAWPWPNPRAPTVVVIAGANDPASQALARDVSERLGSFQPIHFSVLRLVGSERVARRSDLIVQVGRMVRDGRSGANLVLTTGRGNAILWSRNIEQPSAKAADLRQQVAVTAALLLDCVDEAMASPDRLNEQTLKAYLGACVAIADPTDNSEKVVQTLQQVVAGAPRFGAAWAKLLYAEAGVFGSAAFTEGQALKLKRHIVEARRIEPDMAEAYIAEAILQPDRNFVEKGRLLKTAVARNPNNASAHIEYAWFLGKVGLLDDAVLESRQAVRLDPLSPHVHDAYVTDLAIAGRLDAARAALRESERLWPGSASALDSRYRFNLRFGDPREALRMLRWGEVDYPGANIQTSFLEARIDPSPENVNRAIEQVRIVMRSYPEVIDGPLQTLAQFGRKDEVVDLLLKRPHVDESDLISSVIFRPAFRDIHRDPRFIQVAEHLGLLKYWRTTNEWPDFCFQPDLPYDCKVEAAKLAST